MERTAAVVPRARAAGLVLSIVVMLLLSSTPAMALAPPADPVPSPVPADRADAPVRLPSTPGFLENIGQLSEPAQPSRQGFTENLGQLSDPSIRFYTPSGGVALLESGVVITLTEPPTAAAATGGPLQSPSPRTSPGVPPGPATADGPSDATVVRTAFGGSNPSTPLGSDPVDGVSNFFVGSDPSRWATGVRTFREVIYPDLWDGVDLVYRLSGGRLKYDLVLAPGADAGAVRFRVEGGDVGLDSGGGLVVSTAGGALREDPPVAFLRDDPSATVGCAFYVAGDGSYGFSLGARDPSRWLVIDPLVNSTFLGGSNYDEGQAVALTGDGDVLVAGSTRSIDFPFTPGAVQRSLTGTSCAFVSKLDRNLTRLVFSTYFGGTGWDYGSDVGVDGSGNVYLAGVTFSSDLPVSSGAFQRSLSGTSDAFVCKLDANGTSMLYSTYLGGSGKEYASYQFSLRISVDPSGSVLLASSTTSTDMPTTSGALQADLAGDEDGYVCRLNASGASLDMCTYLGGTAFDYLYDMVVSDDGTIYLAGQTGSDDLPTTGGVYQEDHTGDYSDIFVGALAADGGSLDFLTYVGSWSGDSARALAVDDRGAVCVHGTSTGVTFPTTDGAFQETATGANTHPVVFKLSADGSDLVWSTFLAGTGSDEARGIALDVLGNAYLTGYAGSLDFPTTDGCFQNANRGSYDCYFSVLSADGSGLLESTYVGMTSLDAAMGLVFDGDASLYIAGFTSSDRFPTTAGALQGTYGGGNGDAFVMRFVLDLIPPRADAGPDVVVDQHETVTFDASRCWDNLGIVNYSWTFTYDGAPVVLGGEGPSFTFHEAGEYVVNLTVRDLAGNVGWDLVKVTVRDITAPVADAGEDVMVRQYQTVLFDGSGSSDNVGIQALRWNFTYLGTEVDLLGARPAFTFQEAGTYRVLLNVTDAAGNWAVDEVNVTVLDVTAPVADAGRDLTVDQGETVKLDGSGSRDNVGIVGWTWTFVEDGHNVTLEGATPNHTFDVPGVYTVLLTVRDAGGNTATDTVVVEVRDTERPLADAGEDLEVDQDSTVVFDGSGSSDNTGVRSLEWSFEYDGMTVRLEGATPNFFFHTAGVYTVLLTVTDLAGNWGTDYVTVSVLDTTRPIADAGPDLDADQHERVDLDGSGSWDSSGVVRWVWVLTYRGSELSLEGARPTLILDDAGEYRVTLTVFDPTGNNDTDTTTVTILDVTAPVAVAGDDVEVPQGTAVDLDGSLSTDNVGVEGWVWSFTYDGTDERLEGEVRSFTFLTPGVYVVTLEVADAAANTATDPLVVTVLDITPPVAVGPRDMNLDLGDRARFDGSGSTDNVGIVEWKWTISFEGHSYTEELDGPDVNYRFDQAGKHKVMLTVTDAQGNSDSMTFTVTVEGGVSPWWIVIVVIVVVFVLSALYIMRGRRGSSEG